MVDSTHYHRSKRGISALGTSFTIKSYMYLAHLFPQYIQQYPLQPLECVLARGGSSTVNLLYVNLARQRCLVKHQLRCYCEGRRWVKQFTLHNVGGSHPFNQLKALSEKPKVFRRKRDCLDCLQTQEYNIDSRWNFPANFRLASPHNCTNQFLKINLSIYMQ